MAFISRASLLKPRSHGFSRFFAWAFLLALILLNLEEWFKRPFSPQQLVSWILLAGSVVLVVHGFWLLRVRGKPDPHKASDIPQMGIEKTTILVTSGAYKYIRHPLYASLFLLAGGAFFKKPSWPGAVLAVLSGLFLYFSAITEEKECLKFFGPAYEKYMRRTKMFIPLLF